MRRKAPPRRLAAGLFLLGAGLLASPPADQELLSRSRSAVATLQRSLLAALGEALEKGGALGAVELCREKAPLLAEAASRENGVEIRRTALKVRNPRNAPDDWERGVLAAFEEKAARREEADPLERWEVRTEGGRPVFRYMKAIFTGEPCLRCHGPSLEEPLQRRIQALYPDDRAVGFRKGDLRGAFSVRIPLGPRGNPLEPEPTTPTQGGSP